MNINVTLIAQVIVFILLVLFTMKFVWPPIVKALDERANKIAEGLSAAERGKADLEKAEKKAEEVLAQAYKQVSATIASADQRAGIIRKEAKEMAEKEAELILKKVKDEIAQTVAQARADLRQEVTKLAIAGAEKILRKEIDSSKYAEDLRRLGEEL